METRMFGGVEYTAVKIKTSEVKKGDIFNRGNTTEKAYSDAEIYNGVWSVDIDPRGMYSYGWQSIDTEVTVYRK